MERHYCEEATMAALSLVDHVQIPAGRRDAGRRSRRIETFLFTSTQCLALHATSTIVLSVLYINLQAIAVKSVNWH